MVKRKKKAIDPPVLVHYARVEEITIPKRGKPRPLDVDCAFVLAWDKDGKRPSMDIAQEMVEEDWYGLSKQGFEPVGYYRLTRLGGKDTVAIGDDIVVKVRMPESGCYEHAAWLYLDKRSES